MSKPWIYVSARQPACWFYDWSHVEVCPECKACIKYDNLCPNCGYSGEGFTTAIVRLSYRRRPGFWGWWNEREKVTHIK